MAKKTIDKDTKVTTAAKVEDAKVVSEQKEENVNVVDLDKTETTDAKKDVSEVVTPDTDAKNIETSDIPDNAENLEKLEISADVVNESETSSNKKDDDKTDEKEDSKDDNEDNKNGYDVDTPSISELIDPESNGSISTKPTYIACPPIKDSYVYAEATPVYEAQCPPKPATEKPDAYVAQRPY